MRRISMFFVTVALAVGMAGCVPAQHNLTVSSTEGGDVVSPGEGTFTCYGGRGVNLLAVSHTGYRFVNWTGDVCTVADVNAAVTTITMNCDYSITANFEESVGGGCFIATAAYGTPLTEDIEILREFRDEYLLTNPLGQAVVDLYYRISPPLADFINGRPSLKPLVRVGLFPAVAMSSLAVNATPTEKTVILGVLVLVSVILTIWAIRRPGRGREYASG